MTKQTLTQLTTLENETTRGAAARAGRGRATIPSIVLTLILATLAVAAPFIRHVPVPDGAAPAVLSGGQWGGPKRLG